MKAKNLAHISVSFPFYLYFLFFPPISLKKQTTEKRTRLDISPLTQGEKT